MFQKKIFLLLFFNIFALSAQINNENAVKKDTFVFDSIIHIQKIKHLLGVKYTKNRSLNIAGKKIHDTLYIYIQNKKNKDTIVSTFGQIENDLNQINRQYYSKGYIFNKLVPDRISIENNRLKIYYNLINLSALKIDSITYTSKIPDNIVKHINKNFLRKVFSAQNTNTLNKFISNNTGFTVINNNILFKGNKNVLSVDVKKQNLNTIDGLLSFGYDTQKKELLVNGQLNSILYNVLNANERIQLRWQKIDDLQNYLIKTDFPYIFGSNLSFNNTFRLQRKDTSELSLFNKIDLGWKYKSHTFSVHYSLEQIKRIENSLNQNYIGIQHQLKLNTNTELIKFGYENRLLNSFSIDVFNNHNYYMYNELIYNFSIIKKQGVFIGFHNYISNSDRSNQLLNTINDIDRNNTIDFNKVKSMQLIKSSYYFANKNQIFYTIHDFVNENTTTKQHKAYINIGVGGQLLRKNQNLTLNLYIPIFLTKVSDYQKVYISIRQLFRF